MEFAPSGSKVREVPVVGDTGLRGLSWGPNGNLFVGSINTGTVLEFDPAGKAVRAITAPGLDPRFVLFAPTR